MRSGSVTTKATGLAVLICIAWLACPWPTAAEAEPIDEAKAAGKTVSDFPETAHDFFPDMDGGTALDSDEIKGRHTWLTWTGGNQAFWDYAAQHAYGLADLLKTLDSRKRGSRFKEMGLISEPGFRPATEPDAQGLWLDERLAPEPPGANPEVDGRSSGIVGLRLFPNPAFAAARAKWNPEKFYNDPAYSNSPGLVRPYRVGMSCAFCHVCFHPLHPPKDPENPDWTNLSSNIGNQYWRTTGVFGHASRDRASFAYALLNSARPGTVDTSLLASDGNNNPTAINPLFQLGARLARAEVNPPELILPENTLQHVPRVLMDGADSIGVMGAIMRVYVSIGLFHQQWLRDHNLLVGLRPQKPFSIAAARRNSVYWQVTEQRAPNVAKFLAKMSAPMRLADAPGGDEYLGHDESVLARGKIVFAENCIGCHSSKQPPGDPARDPAYLDWARHEVMKPGFLDDNYLSTDLRHPVTLIKTNAGRAFADNAARDHVWNDFSSDAYKQLPAVGAIDVADPFDGSIRKFQAPDGGPGYYRAPSLVGIWATAPFLHNNSVGLFNGDPSVKGRINAFNDAIEKLLWPEKRLGDGSILRTTEKTWLRIPSASLPDFFGALTGGWCRWIFLHSWLVSAALALAGVTFFALGRKVWARIGGGFLILLAVVILSFSGPQGDLEIGPIPAGTPINLLANINPNATDSAGLLKLALKIQRLLRDTAGSTDDAARQRMREEVGPELLRLSKSPDFVEDRGHEFGTTLSDDDKRALIEFLKTF